METNGTFFGKEQIDIAKTNPGYVRELKRREDIGIKKIGEVRI